VLGDEDHAGAGHRVAELRIPQRLDNSGEVNGRFLVIEKSGTGNVGLEGCVRWVRVLLILIFNLRKEYSNI
jgi:hypothetical protein